MLTTPCMICQSPSVPHTEKNWGGTAGLHKVEYSRCIACGFVKSETHFAMTETEWMAVNENFHSSYQGSDENVHDPRWLERLTAQRNVLALLHGIASIPKDKPWLDWGAGDGKLSQMLAPCGVELKSYDAYMARPSFLTDDELIAGGFDLVVSTSVIEHVRSLETLDSLQARVSDNGILAIHTVVADEVPTDPNWFYYLESHVSFFTNESMRLLFDRWGYSSSIYHVPSTMWFFFKNPDTDIEGIATRMAQATGKNSVVAETGFVAYWTNARLRGEMVS